MPNATSTTTSQSPPDATVPEPLAATEAPPSFDPAALWAEFLEKHHHRGHDVRDLVRRVQALSVEQKLDTLVVGVNAHQAAFPRVPGDRTYGLKELDSFNAIERLRYSMNPDEHVDLVRLGLQRQLPVTFWEPVLDTTFPGALMDTLGALDMDNPSVDPAPLIAALPTRAITSMIAHISYASDMIARAPDWMTGEGPNNASYEVSDEQRQGARREHQRRQALIGRDKATLIKLLDRLPDSRWNDMLARHPAMAAGLVPEENLPRLLRHVPDANLPGLLIDLAALPPSRFPSVMVTPRLDTVLALIGAERLAVLREQIAPPSGTDTPDRVASTPHEEHGRERLNERIVAFFARSVVPPADEATVLAAVEPTAPAASAGHRPKAV